MHFVSEWKDSLQTDIWRLPITFHWLRWNQVKSIVESQENNYLVLPACTKEQALLAGKPVERMAVM